MTHDLGKPSVENILGGSGAFLQNAPAEGFDSLDSGTLGLWSTTHLGPSPKTLEGAVSAEHPWRAGSGAPGVRPAVAGD